MTRDRINLIIDECVTRCLKEASGRYGVSDRTVELYNFIKGGHSVDCYGEKAFTNPRIMENAWVIHFTDSGDDLAAAHGFTFGTNDFVDLANTADGRDYPENPEKGFDFAFLLTSPSELYAKACDAFVFRASGISCQHQGERLSNGKPMRQFIFWCDDVNLKPYYRITHKKSRWNGAVYDDYFVNKNGSECIKTFNEYGFETDSFGSMRKAIQAVIDDINGEGPIITKRLRMQID
jgi:hypothetical protein